MIIGTGGGGGASWGLDGWHCVNTAAGAGGILAGDVELLEHEFPVHDPSLRAPAGLGRSRPLAGRARTHLRGGAARARCDARALGRGDEVPGAGPPRGRLEAHGKASSQRATSSTGDVPTRLPPHGVVPIVAGQHLRTCPPGGGGVGDPHERDFASIEADVRNGFVSTRCRSRGIRSRHRSRDVARRRAGQGLRSELHTRAGR